MAVGERVVVVGLGSIGRRHSRLLAGRGDLIVEWCEISEDSLELARRETGADYRTHPSFEAMLKTSPSMVVVATPHGCHSDQTIAALDAGIHVLCEKPMSDSPEAAEAMARAAERADAVLTIGFHLHFHPALRYVKEIIDSGGLGAVHHLHCRVGSYVTLVNSVSRYQSEVEGAIFMDYAYQPDLFYWLTGEVPRGVYAAGGQGGDLEFQSDPNFVSVTLDYESPLLCTIHLNYLQAPERHEYEIVGDRGWILFDMNSGNLRFGHSKDGETGKTFSTDRDGIYKAEHEAFVAAARGERQPESPASDGLVSMYVLDSAIRSWRLGARTLVPIGGLSGARVADS